LNDVQEGEGVSFAGRGVELNVRDIFREPLSDRELADLAGLVTADGLFSWKSRSARQYLELRETAIEEELLRLMAAEPRLIRRPVTVRGDRAVVGFDREALEELLTS